MMSASVLRAPGATVCKFVSKKGLLALALFSASAVSAVELRGSFSVQSGAANYAVPIQVLPSVGSLAPRLQIAYNSQAGNGVAGMGWGISGLSQIARCPATPASDGAYRSAPIKLATADRFCLDGQKLLLSSGSYGQDGSEYRTESDGYVSVRAAAVSGVTTTAGPAKFVVKTKSGLVMEFGATTDSRIMAGGANTSVVMAWALNKISDVKGNAMSVTYTSWVGEFQPQNISYPGGNEVVFTYEDRPDKTSSSVAGGIFRQTKRLATIASKNGSRSYNYTLSYKTSSTGRSLLQKITLCAGGSCVPALSLDYTDASLTTPGNVVVSGHGIGDGGWDIGDIFGDGTEVYWTHNSLGEHFATRIGEDGVSLNWKWSGHKIGTDGSRLINAFGGGRKVYWTRTGATHYITQLNKDGTSQSWTYSGGQNIGNGGWDIVSLFGDGREVYWTRNDSTHFATQFNQDGTFKNWVWSGHGIGESGHRFVNIFGDGRMVYWTRSAGTHYVSRFNDDGTVENWNFSGHAQGTGGFDFGDLFGEGRDVYWTRNDATHYATRFNVEGTSTSWTWSGHNVGNGGTRLVDLFGDGRKVYWTRDNSTHFATRLNPDGTSENFSWAGQGVGDNGWDFVDLYGDGHPVYWTFSKTGQHFISRFFADGSVQNTSWMGHREGLDGWRMVDFAGKGRKSYWTHSGSTQYLTTAIAGDADLLKTVQGGVGDYLNVKYAHLPELERSGVGRYARDLLPAFPVINAGSSMVAVDSIAESNGVGGSRETVYSYGNLLMNLNPKSRGPLGFQWTQTQDVSSGLVSRTCYRQDWPYIGMVDKVMTATSDAGLPACNSITSLSLLTTPGSNLLSLTTNLYKFLSYAPSDTSYTTPITCTDDKTQAACNLTAATAPGQRYQIWGFQSLTQSRDWDGTNFIALPASRTTVKQDNWGNVTEVKAETLNADGSTPSGYSKTTTNTYMPVDTTNWQLGRLQKSQVQAVSP